MPQIVRVADGHIRVGTKDVKTGQIAKFILPQQASAQISGRLHPVIEDTGYIVMLVTGIWQRSPHGTNASAHWLIKGFTPLGHPIGLNAYCIADVQRVNLAAYSVRDNMLVYHKAVTEYAKYEHLTEEPDDDYYTKKETATAVLADAGQRLQDSAFQAAIAQSRFEKPVKQYIRGFYGI